MTPLSAATATNSATLIGIAVGTVLLWSAGYVIACAFWPFAACGRCDGTGKHRSPSGKAWRKCRRCRGSAARLRFGRRVFNWLRKTEADAV